MLVRTYNFNDNEFKVYFSNCESDFDVAEFKCLEIKDLNENKTLAITPNITLELAEFLIACVKDLSDSEGLDFRFVGVKNEQRCC